MLNFVVHTVYNVLQEVDNLGSTRLQNSWHQIWGCLIEQAFLTSWSSTNSARPVRFLSQL